MRSPSPFIHATSAALAALLLALHAIPAQAHLSIIREGPESGGAIEAGDRYGAAIAAGDFNGDGYDDVAVGAPGEDLGALSNAGAVIVNYGSALGITHVGAQVLTAASLGKGGVAGAQFGFALLAADFNRDGRDDLVIGAPYENVNGVAASGRFYVTYGTPSGFGNSCVSYDQSSAGGAIELNDKFGFAFASGNFDGDGNAYPDLAIGAPGEDGEAGAVSINYMGGPFGLSSGIATSIKQSSLGGFNDPNDAFGRALAAGNLIGSSHDDLAIGMPYDGGNLFQETGVVYVVRGSAGGLTTSNPLLVGSDDVGALQSFAHFGYALATGRFFSGSYLSLAIGEPGRDESGLNNSGRVVVIEGGATGLDLPNRRVLTQNSGGAGTTQVNDRFGEALAAGEYYGADGYDDLAIGSPQDGFGVGAVIGNLHIFPGGVTGPTGAGWSGFNQGTCNEPAENGDEFGAAIAYGHFDDTGFGGFVVGAPGERYEDTIAEPDLLLDDAGMVVVIAPWRQAFGLSCRRSVVADCSGRLVFSQKPFERVYIASTTKALTLLVAAEHIQLPVADPEHVDPNTDYTVPNWVASQIGGSQFGLWPAEHMTLIDLMYACLYRSGNDAAYAIADVVGDGATAADRIADFIGDMNAKAAALGMTRSHFNNPPGFQQEAYGYDLGDHYSTAWDMAILSRAVLENPLTFEISRHLTRDIVRHLTFLGYPYDLPWTIKNFFPGIKISGANGIKGGYTGPARITGLFSLENSLTPNVGGSSVIATTFTTDTLPKGAYVNDAKALLQLGLNECSTFFLIPPPDPQPFRLVLSGLSTANGSGHGASADVAPEVTGPLTFDVFRQTGSGPASARVDLWHTAEVTLPPGATASLGIGPFQMHRAIHVLNMGDATRRIRITPSFGGPAADHTLAPGEEVVLPEADARSMLPGFTLQIGNPDSDPAPVELAVEIVYGFDLTGLGGPDTRPAFSARLERGGPLSNEGISVLGSGRDGHGGSELMLAVHEPQLVVGVEGPPRPTAGAPALRLAPPAPNPFRDRTTLAFDLGVAATVDAAVFDVAGRRIRSWSGRRLDPGHWGFVWDGSTDQGGRAAAGVYHVRVRVEGREAATGRVVMTR